MEGTTTCFPLQLNRTSFIHTSHSFLLLVIIHMMRVKPRTVHIRTERVLFISSIPNYEHSRDYAFKRHSRDTREALHSVDSRQAGRKQQVLKENLCIPPKQKLLKFVHLVILLHFLHHNANF